jgi:hypothetical protein
MKDKAYDADASALHRARETTSAVTDKARDAASTVGQRVSGAASAVGHKAEEATHSVGSGMESLAGTVRGASSTVADSLERGGRYLKEEGLSGVGQDLTNVVRRHPVPALLIALGIGFLIARSTRS